MSDTIDHPKPSVIKKAILTGLLILISCICATCAYTYYIIIPKEAERRITKSLKTFGFNTVKIRNIKRSNNKITFLDIALDDKKFSTIDSLTIRFSLWRFYMNPENAQSLHIKNLHLTGEIDQNLNIQISGWNNTHNIIQSLNTIPANAITIENSKVDLLSDKLGGISMTYNAYFNLRDPESIRFQSTVNSRQKRISFQSTLNGEIHAEKGIVLKGDIEQIALNHSHYALKRGAGHIDLTYKTDLSYSAEAQFSSASFHNLPLKDVRITCDNKKEDTVILAEGTTFGPEKLNWHSKASIINNVTTSETHVEIPSTSQLTQFVQRNNIFQSNMVFPWEFIDLQKPKLLITTHYSTSEPLTGSFKVSAPTQTAHIKGSFNKTKQNESISGEFHLKKIKIKSKDDSRDNFFDISAKGNFTINTHKSPPYIKWIAITDIHNGQVDYGALSFPTQKSSIIYNTDNPKAKQRIPLTLPLKPEIKHDAYITLGLTKTNTPHLKSLNLEIYDGLLQTQDPIFINGSLAKDNTITVSDINVGSLFKDFGLSSIHASGRMSGIIPLKINQNANGHEIEIKSGILQSIGTGRIQLPENIILGLFPNNTPEIEKKRSALKNFHYDYFELRLDGSLTGKVLMTLNAKGVNPSILPIKPVDINLQIESELSFLLKNLIDHSID